MKIISKHKDYYDYFQGVYGADDKLVYERPDAIKFSDAYYNERDINKLRFAIADRFFTVFYYMGEFFHTEEELLELYNLTEGLRGVRNIFSGERIESYSAPIEKRISELYKELNKKCRVNRDLRQPVLFETWRGDIEYYMDWDNPYFEDSSRKVKTKWGIPLLKTFSIPKYIDAHEIYLEISRFMGWLVDNPPIPDNMTDSEKVISHGFDIKKSFRHRK